MANFTKDYRDTIQDRLNQDSDFAQHLLDEAISLILNDEPETARLVLRDLVNATIGFEKLSDKTQKNSKSLHRMLTVNGNPSMNNLTHIINVLRETLKVDYEIHAVPA
ncbi:MAG: transcriptional regulator [Candidatus Marinimicrobia bacterium]|jgi:DNA-binding phage protein|nr:transcriptional regulator [Candidatus Neomarinimicrobiota bacterium]MBT3692053.1 transcriptional regulator [Candidatus Neomarinimicrobiota bacterium]MBT4177150.1 transcriptional regulator [Candidatus Neomarinimicrobiota bacterium]MBT5999604.1 transcriptional regulator [Candidatus Neomarinimicrobiota bacterium]MBT6159201.1 transcriptional regulator [Candidatus Neomarinimicrobiota bacterium]